MDQDSLVMEEKDAGADLVRRFNRTIPVEAAFWIKAADEDRWNLCIASKQINDDTFDLGLGEVLRLTQEMNTPYIDPFQVRVLRSDDPLTRAALEVLHRFPGNTPTWARGGLFEAPNIDMAYIYPKSLATN